MLQDELLFGLLFLEMLLEVLRQIVLCCFRIGEKK
jgi:hypothetical protein